MAIIYTDNIFGLDTNSGLTSSTPLKSIDAALQIASNGDQIRVAGGSFSLLPGFLTNTSRATTLTTSQDWTAAPYGLTAGDTIAIDTLSKDGWPIEYSTWWVQSTTPTTITLRANAWLPFGDGTYSVYKFGSGSQSYHYQTTLTTGFFETMNGMTVSDVSVSGGWNSTFDTQWGWTGIKSGQPNAVSSYRLFNSSASYIGANVSRHNRPGVVFDKFLFNNCRFDVFASGSIYPIFGFDRIMTIFTQTFRGVSNVGQANPGVTASGLGLYPWNSNKSTFIQNGSNGALIPGEVNSGSPAQPYNIDYWVSASGQSGDGNINWGTYNGYIDILKFRSTSSAAGTGTVGLNLTGFAGVRGSGINQLDIYMYGTSSYQLNQNQALPSIKSLNFYRPDSTNTGIHMAQLSVASSTFLKKPIKMTTPIENLRWFYTSASTYNLRDQIEFQHQSSPFVVNDSEGYKVIDAFGVVRYADSSTYSTGTQSMRINTLKNPAGFTAKTFDYYVGSVKKPSGNFTISYTAKTNVASLSVTPKLIWDLSLVSDYGSTNLTTRTFNTNWQTFTQSITVSSLVGAHNGMTYSTSPTLPMPVTFNIGDTQATYGTQSVYVWIGDLSVY